MMLRVGMMLGAIIAAASVAPSAWVMPSAQAQSIGDWSTTYHGQAGTPSGAPSGAPSASASQNAPRIEAAPVFTTTPSPSPRPKDKPRPAEKPKAAEKPAEKRHEAEPRHEKPVPPPVAHKPETAPHKPPHAEPAAPVAHAPATPKAPPPVVHPTPAPVAKPTPQPSVAASPAPAAAPAAPATASPTPAPTVTPTPKPTPPHLPAPKPVAAPAPAPLSDNLPQWPLGVAALLGGLGGWLLWRRKRKPADTEEPEKPEIAEAETAEAAFAEPAPAPTPPPVAAPEPEPEPLPVFKPAVLPEASAPIAPAAPVPEELSLEFEPTRFATTLSEATLRYRLTVTNLSAEPLGPLAINGRMEAASPEEEEEEQAEPAPVVAPEPPAPPRPVTGFQPNPQFAPPPPEEPEPAAQAEEHDGVVAPESPVAEVVEVVDASPVPTAPALTEEWQADAPSQDTAPDTTPNPTDFAELHRLMILRPGESIELRGQIHLPLSAITPLRVGAAELFVPLVHLTVEGERIVDEGNPPPATGSLSLMVGEKARQKASLAPFRLDTGPAIAGELTTRPLPSA